MTIATGTGDFEDSEDKQRRRDWSEMSGSPLEYFRKKFGGKKFTRSEPNLVDKGLYDTLRKMILEEFRENYSDREDITRTQLKKENHRLYGDLLRFKLLDETIPTTKMKRKDWSVIDPVEYFKENYGDREDMTRSQLQREDGGLFQALIKHGQMDEAVPIKKRDWSNTDPVQYFRDNYGDSNITRAKLQREDAGLYELLRRKGLLDDTIPGEAS